jgi:hypothetical protein
MLRDLKPEDLVTKLGKLGALLHALLCLFQQLRLGHLALVVRLTLDLALLLQTVYNILVAPSNLMRDSLQGAVLCDERCENRIV